MTEIFLIRHAEAEGNVFRRFQGQYETLLTPRGHQQVACLAKRFESIHIDACYSSDMTRTSQTAGAIYIPKGLPLRWDPRFRELDVGVWEDRPFGWLRRFEPEMMYTMEHDPAAWHCEGGETFEVAFRRFHEGLTEVARAHDGETIAVFSHGGLIRNLLQRVFFADSGAKVPYCDNTAVSKLIYEDGHFSYEYVNDNSHLPQTLSTHALQRRDLVDCWFRPYGADLELPAGLDMPERQEGGACYAAILQDKPVGLVSLGMPEGETGRILGMTLAEGMEGCFCGDQLLGQAISHFRRLGCKRLAAAPGDYPDDVLRRYGFEGPDRSRSINVNAFDWNVSAAH